MDNDELPPAPAIEPATDEDLGERILEECRTINQHQLSSLETISNLQTTMENLRVEQRNQSERLTQFQESQQLILSRLPEPEPLPAPQEPDPENADALQDQEINQPETTVTTVQVETEVLPARRKRFHKI